MSRMLTPIPEPPVLHRAKWVVPVSAPPISNGAVLIHGGRILAAGPFPAMRTCSPVGARLADHGDAALLPALVNAHTHLELGALAGRIPFPQPGFREWIKVLFPLRIAMAASHPDETLRSGLAELSNCGTALCADITNGACMADPTSPQIPERQIFLELLGFNIDCVSAAMPPGIAMPDGAALVPHSVYSVSPALIAEIQRMDTDPRASFLDSRGRTS